MTTKSFTITDKDNLTEAFQNLADDAQRFTGVAKLTVLLTPQGHLKRLVVSFGDQEPETTMPFNVSVPRASELNVMSERLREGK